MMQSSVQPPTGYRFISYALSNTSISNGARIDLPFGFDNTDEIITIASCDDVLNDKFVIAPSNWNNNRNRFALVGGPNPNNFGVGYGSTATTAPAVYWSTSIIQRDANFHTWIYKNYCFSIDNILSKIDVSSIAFMEGTKNLRLFYGYNANTSGKIMYYKHKKADGTMYNIVPIQHKTTGVVEMYDTVSKTIMPRTGTLYPPEE